MNIMKRLSAILFFVLASSALLQAQTGKIVGKVTDAQNGEGIPNATILVVGTTRGAATDFEGKYQIIGVPLGSYTVRASLVGYRQHEISGVKVGSDETTSLNFKLNSSEVEMQGVTISADQQLVNSLSTSSTQTVSAKSIEQIPNVKDVQDVLKLQAGIVKKGNQIFVRGGRPNEVQYLVDGIPVNDILSGTSLSGTPNDQLATLYSGQAAGAIGGGGLSVSAAAIQSVSVQASNFDADYGNAQSGIINIVTKSGSDKYNASMEYRTDKVSDKNQNEVYSSFSLGGPEPLTKFLLPGVGLHVPGTLTFFLNADVNRSDGIYRYAENEFYNPLERRIELEGFLGGLLNGFGFRYRENQSNNFTFNSKIKYDPNKTDQITYSYTASLGSRHDYNPFYKFFADSSGLSANLSVKHGMAWTHFIGDKTFMRLNLGLVSSRRGNDIGGLKPWDYSSIQSKTDPDADGFVDLGMSQGWYSGKTNVYTARFDYNSQIHPLHLFKAGVEFNYEAITATEIENPTVPKTDADGNQIYPPYPDSIRQDRGQYPGYGLYRWALDNYPNRGAMYIQDNIEFSGLNLHLGLRYDYLDLGKQIFYEDFISNWTAQTQLPAEWIDNRKGESSFLYYATHGYFSPRLQIGYPVTDRIVFYFNYGHFIQFLERDLYFTDPFTVKKNHPIGNPGLKPKRTVAYEAGFEDQFSDDMAFSVRAFYKDIFDYETPVSRGDVTVYRNFDYASSRGFELTFNQAFTGNFSANVTYSYQIAKGRSSNPLASIITPEFQLPRETRLDWDQNHTVNLFTNYRVGPREKGHFFGLPFVNNYGISLTWSYGSGYPYTPDVGRVTSRNVYLKNNESRPYTSEINLSLNKGFILMNHFNLQVTLNVTNLLDRQNVSNVYAATGRPPEFGDKDVSSNVILPWYNSQSRLAGYTFSSPRQILLGLKLNWD